MVLRVAEPELIESTGDRQCDKIAQGVIGIFEGAFPGRVRGFYLRGSHASDTSIASSDLDLLIVFKDRITDKMCADRSVRFAAFPVDEDDAVEMITSSAAEVRLE
jgi:hypothetical protein